MSRKRWLAVALFALLACNVKQPPYLKHKLAKAEKLAEGCEAYDPAFKIEASIIGERYTFKKCLHTTYDGHYAAERNGDTIVVKFTNADGPKALYSLTLDVDAYPRYHFLTVDGNTFAIVSTQN